ncbi:hypothetical protein K4F52_006163 [Lecanicillium sp. MT-2017a]|nr:hypothetical protein K4F52_006163 [Lecanicillium sp. MT-2017a]
MAVSTLSDGTKTAKYMPMTSQPLLCAPPVLPEDLDTCGVPGGGDLWSGGGFYSPGQCFIGYVAMCTQTTAAGGGWPVRSEETAVRCIPSGYACNAKQDDQRYATSMYDGTTLSAPAFEIRWRSDDVRGPGAVPPAMTSSNLPPTSSADATAVTSVTRSVSSGVNLDTSQGEGGGASTSSGKVAGIVVGSVLACSLCAVGAVLVWQRRRRRRRQKIDKVPEGSETTSEPMNRDQHSVAELHDKAAGPRELEGNSCPADARHSHISLNKSPIELPAD